MDHRCPSLSVFGACEISTLSDMDYRTNAAIGNAATMRRKPAAYKHIGQLSGPSELAHHHQFECADNAAFRFITTEQFRLIYAK
jgi:hypothetical protein